MSHDSATLSVHLKPKRDRRALSGHPWIFSNEVDGDVSALPPGGVVDVYSSRNKFVGRGYANPNSLICIRLCSGRKDDIDHPAFWSWRVREALALRRSLYPDRTAWRLLNSEADGVPGVVVDCFGDVLSVQLTTLGAEHRKSAIASALQDVTGASAAVLRSEGRNRQLEGLDDERGVLWGEPPDTTVIDEWGVRFQVPLLGGQKTGHFFDQADNRHFAGPLCRGRTVLDVYANGGGWALHALAHGATHATAVDKSAECAQRIVDNGELNGFGDRLTSVQAEGKKFLEHQVVQAQQYGAVVLDPPAFAKTKKAAGPALRGYRDINALGLQLVEEGGFFFTSSCSFHVHEDRFLEAIREAASMVGRRLRVIRRGEQSSDHPVVPGIPESRYLKSLAFAVHMA